MDSIVSKLKHYAKILVRKKRIFSMNDMSQTKPISESFGLDRGTPIDRYYIQEFLVDCRGLIRGDALEIGELRYLGEYDRNLETRSILAPHADVVSKAARADEVIIGDLTDKASLPSARFDCFLCTQTLNFIYDLKASVQGAHYLLKPGGHFIGTVSGISQISRYDMDRWGDYWRFTTLSLRRLLNEVFEGDVQVVCFGNSLAAQLFLKGVAVEDIPDRMLLNDRDNNYQVLIGFVATKDKPI